MLRRSIGAAAMANAAVANDIVAAAAGQVPGAVAVAPVDHVDSHGKPTSCGAYIDETRSSKKKWNQIFLQHSGKTVATQPCSQLLSLRLKPVRPDAQHVRSSWLKPPKHPSRRHIHLQSFHTLYGDLQAYNYNRRGLRSWSANAVIAVAASARAHPQSIVWRSCH